MEEAREKIELFRTYYLVCFRSFDQDPYSPTHLEPLNMYIIVFREGILSVKRFSFSNRRVMLILRCYSSISAPLPTPRMYDVASNNSKTTLASRPTGSPTHSSTTSPMRLVRSSKASSTKSTASTNSCSFSRRPSRATCCVASGDAERRSWVYSG
jgi:hypothetical protein